MRAAPAVKAALSARNRHDPTIRGSPLNPAQTAPPRLRPRARPRDVLRHAPDPRRRAVQRIDPAPRAGAPALALAFVAHACLLIAPSRGTPRAMLVCSIHAALRREFSRAGFARLRKRKCPQFRGFPSDSSKNSRLWPRQTGNPRDETAKLRRREFASSPSFPVTIGKTAFRPEKAALRRVRERGRASTGPARGDLLGRQRPGEQLLHPAALAGD